jgi:hypothetical protein
MKLYINYFSLFNSCLHQLFNDEKYIFLISFGRDLIMFVRQIITSLFSHTPWYCRRDATVMASWKIRDVAVFSITICDDGLLVITRHCGNISSVTTDSESVSDLDLLEFLSHGKSDDALVAKCVWHCVWQHGTMCMPTTAKSVQCAQLVQASLRSSLTHRITT